MSFVPAPKSWYRPAGDGRPGSAAAAGGSQRRPTDAGIFTEEEGRLDAVAAMRCLLAVLPGTISQKVGTGLNAFAITFEGRIPIK
jgi:hypothetical protein